MVCLRNEMKEWLLTQTFYHGLTNMAHDHIDTAVRWSFTFNISDAKKMFEKMIPNQDKMKRFLLVAAKMNLLMKRLEDRIGEKMNMQVLDARTCMRSMMK